MVLNRIQIVLFLVLLGFLSVGCTEDHDLSIRSEDGLNKLSLELSNEGKLFFTVERDDKTLVKPSELGLLLSNQDLTEGLEVESISKVNKRREKYELKVSNFQKIDHVLNMKSITFKNKSNDRLILDIVSSNEGVAFRYRLPEADDAQEQVINEEVTTFNVSENAEGWLMPYNLASEVTPAYEDFYFHIKVGDTVMDPRNPSSGWSMPALFNVNSGDNWVLVAESSSDGKYPGTHLVNNSDNDGYRVVFARDDERYTVPIDKNNESKPRSKTPWATPWRVIVIGDNAGEIMLSSLITDLAPASKIEDTSWIQAGKASWSWWSNPDDQSAEIYNKFTDLAEFFSWDYTLFDAGWENANEEKKIVDSALSKGIKPLVWGYSADYFNAEERKKRFKEFAEMGIKGVKIDFWCSDRQEVMGALQGLFEDAAREKLLVNLHGVTMPRGWQRTWPNFLTAEAVLGTESYFYEERFPKKAAQQNTILPFTRNVAGPTDYTPFALTMRKFPRVNTGAHELASSMIYTSGIIHFAESEDIFMNLPDEVKQLFKEMPATWDDTKAIVAEPGNAIVLSRKKDSLSYIIGINGAEKDFPIEIDLTDYAENSTEFQLIHEGEDSLMDFSSEVYPVESKWTYKIKPRGGFVIRFLK